MCTQQGSFLIVTELMVNGECCCLGWLHCKHWAHNYGGVGCGCTVGLHLVIGARLSELTSYPGLPPRLNLAADFSPRLRDKVWAGGLGTRLE